MCSHFREFALKPLCLPRLRKKPDLVILHTGTNDLKSVNSPEEIANEITSLALSVKENGQQIADSGIIPQEDRFSKKAKRVNEYLEVQYKDHNLDFISNKNINTRANLNQDVYIRTEKDSKRKTIFLNLLIIFTFESLYLQHQQVLMKIVFLIVSTQRK